MIYLNVKLSIPEKYAGGSVAAPIAMLILSHCTPNKSHVHEIHQTVHFYPSFVLIIKCCSFTIFTWLYHIYLFSIYYYYDAKFVKAMRDVFLLYHHIFF